MARPKLPIRMTPDRHYEVDRLRAVVSANGMKAPTVAAMVNMLCAGNGAPEQNFIENLERMKAKVLAGDIKDFAA